MRHEWLLFRVALQFLTRWPVASFEHFDVAWLSQSLRYFPIVGVFVAVMQWLVWFALSLVLPGPVALAFMMGFGLLLTGGFHEDGWADVCDGMGGSSDRERVLVIMKDSRVGAFGAMGLVWMLLSKWTVLSYVGSAMLMLLVLVFAHALSRLSATALIVKLEHVGDAAHSKTKPLGNQMSSSQWFLSVALALLPICAVAVLAFFAPGPLQGQGVKLLMLPVLALVAAGVCGVLSGWYFKRRIGGYTGDCLGATQQVSELLVYAALLAVLVPARWS